MRQRESVARPGRETEREMPHGIIQPDVVPDFRLLDDGAVCGQRPAYAWGNGRGKQQDRVGDPVRQIRRVLWLFL